MDRDRLLSSIDPRRVTIRILRGVNNDPVADRIQAVDIVNGLKWVLFQRFSRSLETFDDFTNRFMGIPVIRLVQFNQSSAGDFGDKIIPISDLTVARIQRILEGMIQSGADLRLTDIELSFVFIQRVEGAGKAKLPPYNVVKETWSQYMHDGNPVNCAAFAIATFMLKGC
jgi:hypothetical protein